MEMVDLTRLHAPLAEELRDAMLRVSASGSFIGGHEVERFESEFRRLVDAKHCVSCANGTDALLIAMTALGLDPGEEVLTPAHSWISTSETVTLAGGTPVFCDSEPGLYTIDPRELEKRRTARTRGVIAVHLFGQPVDLDGVRQFCDTHGLWLIEDCAQAHLARYEGRLVGTVGDAATYSFYPGKNLGAMGDAGCLTTNRDEVAAFARRFAVHGGKNEHLMEGICSRMDALQAAVLNVKLPHLVGWNEMRRRHAASYDRELGKINKISIPKLRNGATHVYHQYVIRVQARDKVRRSMGAAGVPTSVNYPQALPLLPAYATRRFLPDDFPVAHSDVQVILSLPMHPYLTSDEISKVCSAVQTAAK